MEGKKMGRKLGFPTANLLIVKNVDLDEGAYWGTCEFFAW